MQAQSEFILSVLKREQEHKDALAESNTHLKQRTTELAEQRSCVKDLEQQLEKQKVSSVLVSTWAIV